MDMNKTVPLPRDLQFPEIRPVEAVPVEHQGEQLICLRDPQRIAQMLWSFIRFCFLLTRLDGKHSLLDLQVEFSANSIN